MDHAGLFLLPLREQQEMKAGFLETTFCANNDFRIIRPSKNPLDCKGDMRV